MGEGHVLGTHLDRQKVIAESREWRRGQYKEDHDGGVHGHQLQVTSIAFGSSTVRATTKITAWYADPTGAHSGYRLLPSNGRLESDLLEQLSEELAADTNSAVEVTTKASVDTAPTPLEESPKIDSAPKRPAADSPFLHPLASGLPARPEATLNSKSADKELEAKIKNFEEVLHSQGHPTNLVAVKQSGAAVVASASLTAKQLFLASAHDEFEMLDFSADWVHVRISGLSRGWIWRDSVDMPDGIPNTAVRSNTGPAAAPHATADYVDEFAALVSNLPNYASALVTTQEVTDIFLSDRRVV